MSKAAKDAAEKYAKQITHPLLQNNTTIWLQVDLKRAFLAGVAWARRQAKSQARASQRTQRVIDDLRELNRKLDRGEPIEATRVQIVNGNPVQTKVVLKRRQERKTKTK